MQSEEQRQQVKMVTMQALSRLEELKLVPSTSKKDDLLDELARLPSPPKASPIGPSKSATMPRGVYIYGLTPPLTIHATGHLKQ